MTPDEITIAEAILYRDELRVQRQQCVDKAAQLKRDLGQLTNVMLAQKMGVSLCCVDRIVAHVKTGMYELNKDKK